MQGNDAACDRDCECGLDGHRSDSVEVHNVLRTVFETIAMAKVSSSAVEAQKLHLTRESDGITMNRERLLSDAKLEAKRLADAGYVPPLPRPTFPRRATECWRI